MQKKKGISLIVLVITIIVMIILASAVILTINNTNVMDRAENAVNAYDEAQMKNLAALAWSETYLKGEAKTDEEFETAIRQYMLNQGITEAELAMYEITATKTSVNLAKLTTLGNLVISAADYGKTVKYTANGVDNWKVFYKQTVGTEEYVYLITTDILPEELIPTDIENWVINVTDQKVSVTSMSSIERQAPELWMSNASAAMMCMVQPMADYLLAKTHWDSFINDEAYGDNVVGAIGGPTLEMATASWNAKGTIYDTDTSTVYGNVVLSNLDSMMGLTMPARSTYGSGPDNLYSEAWCASPVNSDVIAYMTAEGFSSDNPFTAAHGLRPVVCLKASTPAYVGSSTDIALKEID